MAVSRPAKVRQPLGRNRGYGLGVVSGPSVRPSRVVGARGGGGARVALAPVRGPAPGGRPAAGGLPGNLGPEPAGQQRVTGPPGRPGAAARLHPPDGSRAVAPVRGRRPARAPRGKPGLHPRRRVVPVRPPRGAALRRAVVVAVPTGLQRAAGGHEPDPAAVTSAPQRLRPVGSSHRHGHRPPPAHRALPRLAGGSAAVAGGAGRARSDPRTPPPALSRGGVPEALRGLREGVDGGGRRRERGDGAGRPRKRRRPGE